MEQNGQDLRAFFYKGLWRSSRDETVSGAGSTLDYTEPLRPALSALLKRLEVRVLLDAPCGDFNWMRHVDLHGASYIGIDIVEDIITDNLRRFAAPDRRFLVLDATADPLPESDLVLCRDLVMHLPFLYIARLFENLLAARFRYLLITSHANAENQELPVPGEFRPVNLTRPPFGFPAPPPERTLADWRPGTKERHLLLYRRDEAVAAIERCLPGLRALGERNERSLRALDGVQVRSDLLEECRRLGRPATASARTAAELRRLGGVQMRFGNWEAAVEALTFARQAAPDDAETARMLDEARAGIAQSSVGDAVPDRTEAGNRTA